MDGLPPEDTNSDNPAEFVHCSASAPLGMVLTGAWSTCGTEKGQGKCLGH